MAEQRQNLQQLEIILFCILSVRERQTYCSTLCSNVLQLLPVFHVPQNNHALTVQIRVKMLPCKSLSLNDKFAL